MSNQVCFYFQVHQPYRLNDIRMGDIGNASYDVFDEEKNREIFIKVAKKCYLPMNALLIECIKHHPEFRVAFSFSGVFLEQAQLFYPEVLESFKELVRTGNVEILSETFEHSLLALDNSVLFRESVHRHDTLIFELFNKRPTVFRNTELIYTNTIGELVQNMGFHGIITEGVDRILGSRHPTEVYRLPNDTDKKFGILLKAYQLSDDIAFRFSASAKTKTPLTAETYSQWICSMPGRCVNLFMDYETFGEHQWEDTGIFAFFKALPTYFAEKNIKTVFPSSILQSAINTDCDTYDVPFAISWADQERDLSAWLENDMQKNLWERIHTLLQKAINLGDEQIIQLAQKLSTSDHIYYLSTKYWNDGDVHAYFSPYESPYEACRRLSHATEHLRILLENYTVH